MSVSFVKSRNCWRYNFYIQNQRYSMSGWPTKKAAMQAEARKKEVVENPQVVSDGKMNLGTLSAVPEARTTVATPTDTDFLTLCNRRLDHAKAYFSDSHFQDTLYHTKRWVQEWGKIPCGQISEAMIEQYLLARAKNSHVVANKELRLLRALFNFGISKKLTVVNPTTGTGFFPIEKRRRIPPGKEDVFKVINAADPDTQDYLWTIVLTAARVNEVNSLTWDDVDFRNRMVVLWTRKRKNGNREPRYVPMVKQLEDILRRRFEQREPEKPWVFWHTIHDASTGKASCAPYKDRKKIMATLCKKADVPYFRFHALRHLTASLLDDMGSPIGVIQRILGHQNRRTTEIYLHSVGDSERKALDMLAKGNFPESCGKNSEVPANVHKEYWQRKVGRPSYEVLVKEIESLGYVGTGKKYGVSNNAVKKWLRFYEKTEITLSLVKTA